MSMEIEIFSDRQLASTAEWQRAIEAEQFTLRLAADVEFTAQRGFFPMVLAGKQTGVEVFHDDPREALESIGQTQRQWRYALGFRWLGSRFDELEAAWMAATAYAAATDGLVFDPEQGRFLTPQQSRDLVAQFAIDRPRIETVLKDIEIRFSRRS